MRCISAILMAVLVTGGYYGSICVLYDKYELGLKRREKWVTDSFVLVLGVITLIGTAGVGYVRLPNFSIVQHILTMALLCGMALLAVVDRKKNLIPNRMLAVLALFWTAVAGVYLIFNMEKGFALFCRSLAGAFVGGVIFLLCYLISKGQLGAGDVKLAFVMGLYLTGERIIGGIFYGTLMCCAYSVAQLLRKRLTLKDGVPLAPFLYMGVLITLFII